MPSGTYNNATLFWQHEILHRATLLDYAARIKLYQAERDTLEKEFLAGALEFAHSKTPERLAFTSRCFAEADAAEVRWLKQLSGAKLHKHRNWLYAIAWNKFNRQAQIFF